MLSVASSRLVLITNSFEETYLPSSCLVTSLLLRETPQIYSTYIYFHLDDSARWKQYQYVSQEIMKQICDLETVKPQEILIKVCVTFYNIEIFYRGCGEKTRKQVFLQ